MLPDEMRGRHTRSMTALPDMCGSTHGGSRRAYRAWPLAWPSSQARWGGLTQAVARSPRPAEQLGEDITHVACNQAANYDGWKYVLL